MLSFKHNPQKTDAFLLNLWKFFKYHPLAKNFLDESVTMHGQDLINAECPSKTYWTSHDRAHKAFYKAYQQFLDTLTICYNKHKES